jgi:hypothetical protein
LEAVNLRAIWTSLRLTREQAKQASFIPESKEEITIALNLSNNHLPSLEFQRISALEKRCAAGQG